MPGRILIVESDEAVRNVLCRSLHAQGVAADELQDGSHAVEAIRSGNYTLVLLELAVPVVDGFAVLEAIRNDVTKPAIITLSASTADVRRLAGDAAVTLSINKTFAMRNVEPVIMAIAAVSRMR